MPRKEKERKKQRDRVEGKNFAKEVSYREIEERIEREGEVWQEE